MTDIGNENDNASSSHKQEKYVVTSIKNDNGMKNDNANDKSEKSIVTAPKDKGDKLKMVNEKKRKQDCFLPRSLCSWDCHSLHLLQERILQSTFEND